MEAAELLTEKAHAYELRAAACVETAPIIEGHGLAAAVFTGVAIVLREVAEVFEDAA